MVNAFSGTDTTTFVALFHHEKQAQGVVQDLLAAGVPGNAIYTLDPGTGSEDTGKRHRATLQELHVPAHDIEHFITKIGNGGILIAVAFASDFTDRVEGIFTRHAATKIDDVVIED